MLELINVYGHGYVFVPVVHALKNAGVFDYLDREPVTDICEIEQRFSANSGNLRAAIRMLESMGWIEIEPGGQIRRTAGHAFVEAVDDELIDAYGSNVVRGAFNELPPALLANWVGILERHQACFGTHIDCGLLDGPIVTTLLVGLRTALGSQPATAASIWRCLPRACADQVIRIFSAKGWMVGAELNEEGRFLLERALNLGMAASYWPMLRKMPALLFGQANTVFASDAQGHETHIDRTLNVIASGFQHEKFFSSVDRCLRQLFDHDDFASQPKYIADMGCGDGAFLLRIYRFISTSTLRGKHFAEHPLLLIGIDLNDKALEKAELTLRDLPHLTINGNVSQPVELLQSLAREGIVDHENILHVRSFLDHEVPYCGVEDEQSAAARVTENALIVSVSNEGKLISPAHIVQRYVEHFSRWANVISRFGILILEVHTLPARLVKRALAQTESFHFDAIHAFSRQNLLDAATFFRVLAEAGLFPDADTFSRFPRSLPYTRVTLNWLKKKPYSIRHAVASDVSRLLELEEACWPQPLRIDADEIARRIASRPEGNFVLEFEGAIAGVGYTQRIADERDLYRTTSDTVDALHEPDGPIQQLLAINVHPATQQFGLGDAMLSYLLRLASLQDGIEKVVGVSRCRNYLESGASNYAAYALQTDADSRQIDPILRFHLSHGASIRDVIPGYRPLDAENLGHGVLVEYALRESQEEPVAVDTADELAAPIQSVSDVLAVLERLVRRLKLDEKPGEDAIDRSFRDRGLDSLDLTELRVLINRTFQLSLDSAIFFRHGDSRSLAGHILAQKSARSDDTDRASAPLRRPSARVTPSRDVHRTPSADDIAIIGTGCRFPGGIDSRESLWQCLLDGVELIGAVPPDRWPESITARVPGASWGGFLADVAQFDTAFFGISPREAAHMDPQQRILLETTWHAFEDAGLDPLALRGSCTGVFVGSFGHDYETIGTKSNDYDDYQLYSSTGSSMSILAGRLAYVHDFHGPALTVNTACSSALVGMLLAVHSLQRGECDLAIAGAVNLLLSPELSLIFGRAQMLSPDGHCKTFDAAANGYVRGEGCAVTVLKRYADAVKDGDRILAIIKGGAMNQDGASNGITAPNGLAQEAVVRAALSSAGLNGNAVHYVEAHGTGTPLGDPVEIEALANVYGDADAAREQPLIVGSVKANLGHTEAVAGLAGVIKAMLVLQHRHVPPHPHCESINPLVEPHLARIPAAIATTGLDLAKAIPVCRAGVSSFGYSGTNAHIILEEAPPITQPRSECAAPSVAPFVLSGKTMAALQAQAGQLHAMLAAQPEIDLLDFAYSLATSRSHFACRAAIVTGDHATLMDALERLARGDSAPTMLTCDNARGGRLAVLFTGQGSQFSGMGRDLYDAFPTYQKSFDSLCEQFDRVLQRPLREVVFADAGSADAALLNQTAYTQPALFAMEVALFRLLESWGLKPDLLLGHSLGEISAAHVAGVLSLADACTLVATRARLMQAQRQGGAMVSLQASEDEVDAQLQEFGQRVSIAGINGPHSTVISGDEAPALEIAAHFAAQGRRHTRLSVSHAFHSQHMDGMLDAFRAELSTLTFNSPQIAVVTNISGRIASELDLCNPDYWVKQVRAAVRFADGVRTLLEQGATTYLEIGPQATLSALAQTCVDEERRHACTFLSTSGRDRPGVEVLQKALAGLHVQGHTLDWKAFFAPYGVSRIDLPLYPFQRQHYWLPLTEGKNAQRSEAAKTDAEVTFWRDVEHGAMKQLGETLELIGMEQHAALESLLPSLSRWHHKRQIQTRLDSLRYRMMWRPFIPNTKSVDDSRRAKTWLVIRSSKYADEKSLEELGEAWSTAGAKVVMIELSGDERDHSALATALLDASVEETPVVGVLSLLSLDETPHTAQNGLPNGYALNLWLMKTLAELAPEASIWLLTSGAISTSSLDALLHPVQALNWGLGRGISLERPTSWGGLIDLAADARPAILGELARLLVNRTTDTTVREDQFAVRRAGLFVARLVRELLSTSHAPRSWKPAGTVLVTGGTGALGQRIATWLAKSGAEHIVLVSRRGASTSDERWISDLSAIPGVKVTLAACDVASRESLAALIQKIDAEGPPLRAVFHAAGSMHYSAMLDSTLEEQANVIAGKVAGALHLHELLLDRKLDAFVLFSSISGVWGSGHQSAYCAANAFLDALAAYRRAQGLPATAIAWGPWAAGGMAQDDAVRERLRRYGLMPLECELALEGLQQALDHGDTQSIIADVNWTDFVQFFSMARLRAVLDELPEARSDIDKPEAESGSPDRDNAFVRELNALQPQQRLRLWISRVKVEAAAVLGVADAASLAANQGFFDLGMDSLMALEFRRRLQTLSGQSLPATLVFDYPSIQDVADLLAKRFNDATDTPSENSDLVSTGDMSDVELREMIARIPIRALRERGLLPTLLALAGDVSSERPKVVESSINDMALLDDEALLSVAHTLLGEIADGRN
ncbi:type I polyketide synthase [Paraburkholderia sp. Ac-20347]|uniref:type I polyketide synthase n=1 Tax=Paraburkholderia sp. Ac-20347 TaxID=2703892 RepID=UPI00197DF324|nr:type I polyketide synthase [Paraburkholderia sp. Ac-20347]MBN3809463.1 SDR family NAD(P)-dependent oxidoreductase [Paraburkholderia sp. Ac-20347]